MNEDHFYYDEDEYPDKVKKIVSLPELNNFQMSDDIKITITEFYNYVCGGKIKRKAPRRALIYCSIINVCQDKNLYFDDKQLMSKLDIKVSDINKAKKIVYSVMKDDTVELSMEDLIKTKLKLLDYDLETVPSILIIYQRGLQKIPKFNSSKDETVCETLIYYFLKKNLPEFNEENYFSKSRVSRDTILKLHKLMENNL